MDYEYIQEFGKLKWHTKRVKRMRVNFKNYTLLCNISSYFIAIQTIILLLVCFNHTELYFRYAFLMLLSVFTNCILPVIRRHLTELDDQVTYRINRFETIVKEHEQRTNLIQNTVMKAFGTGSLIKKN